MENNSGEVEKQNNRSNDVAASPETNKSWDETPVPSSTAVHYKEAEAFVVDIDTVDSAPHAKYGTQKQANTYAAKKTVAQGMMDIALITANANQLRYIIEFNSNSSTFYVNLILIIISLILQVGVGISLIFKGRFDLRGQSKHLNARRINNYVVVGVFLVTIINVFVASFTVTGNRASVQTSALQPNVNAMVQ